MKILKYVLIGLAGLFLLLIAAALLIPSFVNPNDYKPQISEAVKKATGRDLDISGDIGLSLFPWVGVDISGVTLSNAPGFGPAPFAQVKQASVKVKLLPLLSKEVEVSTIVLDGATINLGVNEKGVNNWQDMTTAAKEQKEGRQEKERPKSADEPSGEDKFALAALSVGGVEVKNAALHWDDRLNGKKYSVDQVNLKTGAVNLVDPLDIELSLHAASSDPRLDATINLSGKVLADVANMRPQVKNFWLTVDATGDGLPQSGVSTRLDVPSLNLDIKAYTADLEQFTLTVADQLTVTGGAKMSNLADQPNIKGNVAVAPFDAKSLLKALGQTPPETSDPEALRKVAAAVHFAVTGQRISVESLNVHLDEATLGGNATIATGKTTLVRLKLNLDQLDADRYLPPPSDKPVKEQKTEKSAQDASQPQGNPLAALAALDLDARVTVGRIKAMNVMVDKIGANATVKPGKVPDLFFRVDIDKIDANALTSKKVEAKPEKAQGKPREQKADKERKTDKTKQAGAPLAALSMVDCDGRLRVNTIKAMNLEIKDLLVKVDAKDGVLTVKPASLKTCNGTVRTYLTVNAKGSQPVSHIGATISKVQAEPLVTAVAGKDYMHGTINAGVNLDCSGTEPEMIKRTLDGKGNFKISDGAIIGFSLMGLIKDAAIVAGGASENATEWNHTKFVDLSGSFIAKKGLVKNKDLSMKSPLMDVSGKGRVDLPSDTVDYTVTAQLLETNVAKAMGLGGILNIPVPVRVTGTLAKPSIGVDPVEFAKAMTINKGESAVKSILKGTESGASAGEKAVKSILGNIFGGGKN